MPSPITRFAPSPTGYLHLGHAASAAKTFQFAAQRGGQSLLRIEDIDTTRCRLEFEDAIYEDLAWLGFKWPQTVRRQSDHFPDYAQALIALQKRGVVYRCFKTRKEIMQDIGRAPHGHGEVYLGPPKSLNADQELELADTGKPFAWRLSLRACRDVLGRSYGALSFVDNGEEVSAQPELLGDVILARKDVGTSYHLACCHDDALQGITDIVRGVDLLDSTHIHCLLQALLQWPTPTYHHHALLTDTEGKKFSKRDQSLTIRALRQGGASPENVLAMASGLG